MTISSVGTFSSGASGSSSSSVSTANASASVGQLVIVVTASDNIALASGVSSNVVSVTDPAGNSWTKVAEYTQSSGGVANDGTTGSVWYSVITNAITSQAITANFSGSIASKVIEAWKFSLSAVGRIEQLQGSTTSGVNAASMTISGLNAEQHLFIRMTSFEYNKTQTPTSGWTEFADTSAGVAGATAQTVAGEFKISTNSSETSAPSFGAGADSWVGIAFAITETALPSGGLFFGSNF